MVILVYQSDYIKKNADGWSQCSMQDSDQSFKAEMPLEMSAIVHNIR
jgi:hypothetical protein